PQNRESRHDARAKPKGRWVPVNSGLSASAATSAGSADSASVAADGASHASPEAVEDIDESYEVADASPAAAGSGRRQAAPKSKARALP
ncbi:unnamed protein product, partial [Polarella glacialis]